MRECARWVCCNADGWRSRQRRRGSGRGGPGRAGPGDGTGGDEDGGGVGEWKILTDLESCEVECVLSDVVRGEGSDELVDVGHGCEGEVREQGQGDKVIYKGYKGLLGLQC